MKGGKKVNHTLGTKAASSCDELIPSQVSSKGGEKDTGMGSDIQPCQVSIGGKGREKTEEDKQAPSLSHTRATASGREPDLSWSICLCFFPLRKTRESKATKLSRPPEKLYSGDFLCCPEERLICEPVILLYKIQESSKRNKYLQMRTADILFLKPHIACS